MVTETLYHWLANAVLTLHLCLVAFVVLGLVLVLVGNLRHWRWVNNVWFRLAHLATIGVVVAQAWLGIICPLTTLEMWLRSQAGTAVYAGSFIQYWFQQLLYYDAPDWVFILAYSVFALLVVGSWWVFPPRWRRSVSAER
ncbi:DUF2784 domain-containing protein [Halopseudomonas laoshanensis]|uniref:DUF2784 domain-containing protein n=1 Tax=Halopseudomonas laoshanensis TaxID=2268758 RepID=A0A7V7GMP8_9GAMM|nr:DUF2784 domain-containing protein [Halopseudomonas laoshanensis]KAA0690475.1 DUF2784 domain-containing protein [Halopseudomonas laoshanensis]